MGDWQAAVCSVPAGDGEIFIRGVLALLSRQIVLSALFIVAVSLSTSTQADEKVPASAIGPFVGKAAEQHQQAWANKHLKVDVEITNSIGMKLRLIPPGEFMMGSPESEMGRYTDEKQHKVQITKAFYLGKYEVTQGEWKTLMDTQPWKGNVYVEEGDDYAATHVSWNDAVDFCEKLTRKEGRTYRLPTEAEWEYACRGGKTTRFHFGNDDSDLGDYGWYGGLVGDGNAKTEQYAHRVGLKKANPFGLHDMHGNVWEWCSDWYDKKYYASSLTDDPQGPETGSDRSHRGGSWIIWAVHSRSASRNGLSPSRQNADLGFRLALGSRGQ